MFCRKEKNYFKVIFWNSLIYFQLTFVNKENTSFQAQFLNALGMNDFIDIRSNYDTTFYKSEALTTFSQSDRLFIDFGYVTNPGAQR